MRPPATGDRTVFCRNEKCGRTIAIQDPPEGHPYGWYYLTVNVPPWFNADTHRNYRPVGMFCSAKCLAESMPQIEADEELHRQAYEAD